MLVEEELPAQRVPVGGGPRRAVADGLVERDRVRPLRRAVLLQPQSESVVVERARYCEYPVTIAGWRVRRGAGGQVCRDVRVLVRHAVAVEEISPAGVAADRFVKVVFELPRDDDGWPPAASEGLWAVTVTSDTVRLHNTPWFVRGVANGDLIRVRRSEDGQLWADERLEWSGRCAIRIIPFKAGPLGGSRRRVLDAFAPLGVTGEGIEQYGMVALDVPPDVDLAAVKRLLEDGTRDGWWDYEEGCVGDAWMAAEAGEASGV